jgi:SAM-dependent methyltransferase
MVVDRSNGYEGVAAQFLVGRGKAPSTGIGAMAVREWARTLRPGATVIDLGCGSGRPITAALLAEGLTAYAVDASPTLAAAFRRNFPHTPIACEAVEESTFFDRTFDGVVAWGLIFLLSPDAQRQLIQRVAEILVRGGRLLFTSCAGVEPLVWNDAMTGLESRSLGAPEYRRELSAAGLSVIREYEDEGRNHYFDALTTLGVGCQVNRNAGRTGQGRR